MSTDVRPESPRPGCREYSGHRLETALHRVGHGDIVHIERAAHGLIEIQLGLDQVDAIAEFDALGDRQQLLLLDDGKSRGSAELELFHFVVIALLCEDSSFLGGRNRGAVLYERDQGLADIQHDRILGLQRLNFLLALD